MEPWARLDSGVSIEQIADFDGDQIADALVRNGRGGLTLWLVRASVFELDSIEPPADATTRIPLSADLDGDGRTELLWSDGRGGVLVQYLVGGTAELPATETPIARADVDGDGADELVFRDGVSGLVTQAVGEVAEAWSLAAPETAELVGCDDYDGDGTGDLLWYAVDTLHFSHLPGESQRSVDGWWIPLPLCR
jgi:hypothetical protein